MLEFGLWFLFCVCALVAERVLAPRRLGTDKGPGYLTDQLMKMTTVLVLVGPPLVSITGLAPTAPAVVWVGTALAVVGLAIRSFSMQVLGSRYQLTPVALPGERYVVSRGPYSVIRHPGYTGLLLAFAGSSLMFGQLPSLLFFLPMVGFTVFRLRYEESLLIHEFGGLYADYARSVRWRLMPMVY